MFREVYAELYTLFQSPFNLVSVSTIGDELAPTFFYLENLSTNVYAVRVQNTNDLAADTNTVYQVRKSVVCVSGF